MLQLPVSEVMSAPVETVPPERSVRDIAERFCVGDIGSVIVVEDDEPVGIVTKTDLIECMARVSHDETARDVMTRDIQTIDVGATIEAAADTLANVGISKLPVTEDGDIVGVVTTTDLSYYLPQVRRPFVTVPDDGKRVMHVRSDTSYENLDWQFEFHGEDERTVEVGDTARFSKILADEDVRAFADASGDTNRVHLDDSYAKGTRFGYRIAHGVLTAGLISAALARLPGLVIYLSQDLSFLGPVALGTRLTARCTVVDDLGDGRWRLTTAVEDEEGKQVVEGEAVVLVDPMPEE